MKKRLNLSILIMISSALVILGIVICFKNYNAKLLTELESRAEYDLTNSSNQTIHHINSKISDITTTLYNVTDSLIYTTIDVNNDSFKEALRQQSNKNELGILEVFLKSTLDSLLTDNGVSQTDKESIRSLLNGNPVVYFTKKSLYREAGISIAVPIKKNNEVLGILICTYSVDAFSDMLSLKTFDNQGQSCIILKDGFQITNTLPEQPDILAYIKNSSLYSGYSYNNVLQNISNGKSGILHYKSAQHPVYAQYTPLGIADWYLYNVVPATVIEERANIITSFGKDLALQIILLMFALIAIIIITQSINNLRLKQNQDRLLMEKEKYQLVLEHSLGVIWEYDIENDTLKKSDRNSGIYSGLTTIQHLEETLLSLDAIHPEDKKDFSKFCQLLRSGDRDIHCELRGKESSGNYVWFEFDGTTLYDIDGKPVTVIGQTLNIDSRKKAYEELKDNSRRDSLTRLYNRATTVNLIDSYIKDELDPAIHAFFMIDIDNFKSINDTLGHVFGDAVLIEFSSRLNKTFTGHNFAGRIGGDEFVVFLYNIPAFAYVNEQARIIQNMFKEIYTGSNTDIVISGSIGISLYPEHGTSFDTLLKKADIALYHSKGAGKNCYSIYSDKTMGNTESISSLEKDHQIKSHHHEGRTIIDNSIIANTIDILFDSRSIDVSINIILSLIGNHYNLSRIGIIEYTSDYTSTYVSYEWAEPDRDRLMNYLTNIPLDISDSYALFKNNENYIYYCNDITTLNLPHNELIDSILATKTRGLYQCGVLDSGVLKAFINISVCDEPRKWTKTEIDTLTLVCKIIAGYLLKLRSQEEANRIAEMDLLTNCYNLFKFNDEATKIIDNNPDTKYALLYMDIDKFKFINENYGYSEGDHVLISLANTVRSLLKPGELLGRVNADRFIILCKYDGNKSFTQRLSHFKHCFNHIPKTDSTFYKLSIICGIYIISKNDRMTQNIDRANIARKSVTERHKTTFVFFNESMKSRLVKQREIEDLMEDALANGEFVVYYQPKINLSQNRICGSEALVRWNRPGVGLISPGEFIPVFEENGFVTEVDFYVFEQVCKMIRSLLNDKQATYPVSVNFSRVHLKNNIFIEKIKAISQKYNIPPDLLEIEITESALVGNEGYLFTLLHEIHNLGFKLSMDDFGSGLSSLNLLRKLPFDILKLDKEFFHESSTTAREHVVIANVVKMAKELNMEIVSEGVETSQQVEFLKQIQCNIAQGYYYAKPMPFDEFKTRYL